MADRTKEELREFLNGQLHLKPKDRDWALTDGEIHTMLVSLRVLILEASKIVDTSERTKKNLLAFDWATMMGEYCPGFTKYLETNRVKILDEAAEIFAKSEEEPTTEVTE